MWRKKGANWIIGHRVAGSSASEKLREFNFWIGPGGGVGGDVLGLRSGRIR